MSLVNLWPILPLLAASLALAAPNAYVPNEGGGTELVELEVLPDPQPPRHKDIPQILKVAKKRKLYTRFVGLKV